MESPAELKLRLHDTFGSQKSYFCVVLLALTAIPRAAKNAEVHEDELSKIPEARSAGFLPKLDTYSTSRPHTVAQFGWYEGAKV